MSASAPQESVVHAAAQAEHWVVRLASGDLEATELATFKTWLAIDPAHRAAFDRERALWQSLEGTKAAFSSIPVPRRSRLHSLTRLAKPRRALAAAAVAATAVLLMPGLALRLQADVIAERGEVRSVTLPDGSHAMLDSEGAIDIAYSDSERRVRLLRGKAWFAVKHGDPRAFRVAALDGVTQDIGTAFEVDRGATAVTVSVTEGAVNVASSSPGDPRILRASERARYREGGAVERIASMEPSRIAPWRRGIIVVEDRPVTEAIAEVSRYRRGYTWVIGGDAKATRVSGVFRTNAPDEAIATLTQMAGLGIIRLPGGIAIVRR